MNDRLDDIMLYWLPNAGPGYARLYWESAQAVKQGGLVFPPMPIPAGISMFPGEQVRLSRRWAEARFAHLVHFNTLQRGGQFAALEQPSLFVEEIRATFTRRRSRIDAQQTGQHRPPLNVGRPVEPGLLFPAENGRSRLPVRFKFFLPHESSSLALGHQNGLKDLLVTS